MVPDQRFQEPLTQPPTIPGTRRPPPCPYDHHLATRLLTRAEDLRPGCRPGRRPAGLDARYEDLRHAVMHDRARAFPLGLAVLIGKGVTAWQRLATHLTDTTGTGPLASQQPRCSSQTAQAPGLTAASGDRPTGPRPGPAWLSP